MPLHHIRRDAPPPIGQHEAEGLDDEAQIRLEHDPDFAALVDRVREALDATYLHGLPRAAVALVVHIANGGW